VQRRTWIAASVLFATFTIGVWLAEIRHDRSTVERALEQAITATTRLLEEHAARALGAGDLILTNMVDLAAHGHLAPTERPGTARRLGAFIARSPQIGAGWFLDANGDIILDTWSIPAKPGNYAFREYFQAHRGGHNDLFVGPMETGSTSGKPRFTLSRPLIEDGIFAGAAAVNISVGYFTEFYQDSGLGGGSGIHLLGLDGTPLASWIAGSAPAPATLVKALNDDLGRQSGMVHIGRGAKETLVSFRRLADYPVMVLATQPLYPALAPWQDRVVRSGLMVAAALTAFGLLMVMGLRTARRERLALADLKLARTALEHKVAERSAEAERRKEDMRLVADALPALVSYVDRDGRYRFVNQAYKEWFSRELNDIIGLRPVDLFGSDLQAIAQPHHQLARDGQPVVYDTVLSLADGARREVEVQYIPHTGPEGEEGGFYAFAVDVTARRAAERALRKSEQRYRRLFEAMDQGFAVHELLPDGTDYRFLQVNPAFERLTGLAAQDVIGHTVRKVLPNVEEAFIDRYAEVVRSGQPIRFQEHSAPLKRWYEIYAFPIGPQRFATLFDDITDRKDAEDRQTLLMAELDHRVRNILASVQSMVLLTARSATTKEQYAEILRGRVAAMARAHGLLTEGGWRGARLDQIVRDELAPFTNRGINGGGGVTIDGPGTITLKPKDALNVSLVVHELTTNATKYGALSVPDGHVAVRWAVEDGGLRLTWEESGGPRVTPPDRRGFGSVLIENALGGNGTASVDLTFPPEGVRCTITLPRQHLTGTAAPEASSRIEQREQSSGTADAPLGDAPLGDDDKPPRVLIVEDEALVAMELSNALKMAGFSVLGPATTLRSGLTLAAHERFDVAVVDLNLNGALSTPIADILIERGIPFLVASGYDIATMLPPHLHDLPTLQKPADSAVLVSRLRRLIAGSLTDRAAGPQT